jgi:hypothetical protein
MAIPVSYYHETIYDNTVKSNGTPESGQWAVPVTTLTAANYVAKSALISALAAAVRAITLGNLNVSEVVIDRELADVNPASSSLAQRENKLLCRYHDLTSNEKYRVSIPTFDLSLLMDHSEFLDLTASGGLALKTAFEAIVVPPGDASHTVVLDSAQFVGRNT